MANPRESWASLQLIETQFGYTRIDSPSIGVVDEQFVSPGGIARPAAPISTVMDLSVTVARAQFPQEAAG